MKKIILFLVLLIATSVSVWSINNNTILLIYLTDNDGAKYTLEDISIEEVKELSAILEWKGYVINIPIGSNTNMYQFMKVGNNYALQISLQRFPSGVPLGDVMELTVIRGERVVKKSILRTNAAGRQDDEINIESLYVEGGILN